MQLLGATRSRKRPLGSGLKNNGAMLIVKMRLSYASAQSLPKEDEHIPDNSTKW